MKKLVFVIVTLFVAVAANAQGRIYCELLGTQGLFTKKVTVSVDFGQQSRFFSNDTLVDEKGDVIIFNSMVDAMNYMGRLGWEFEQAYVVTLGSGSTSTNVYHWLLSKVVDEDGDTNPLRTVQMVKDAAKAAASSDAKEDDAWETSVD